MLQKKKTIPFSMTNVIPMMKSIKFNNINYVTLTHKQSDVELSTDNKKMIVNLFCYRFLEEKN